MKLTKKIIIVIIFLILIATIIFYYFNYKKNRKTGFLTKWNLCYKPNALEYLSNEKKDFLNKLSSEAIKRIYYKIVYDPSYINIAISIKKTYNSMKEY